MEPEPLLSNDHMKYESKDRKNSYSTAGGGGKTVEYALYTKRWGILAMFCLSNFANALLWVTFAPISDLAQHYFGGRSSPVGTR